MAPQTGIEPMTDRLTADCSTAELLRNMLLYSQQHYLSTEILVSVARIELALHAPKARVIPFHYTEKNWLHLLGSNQPLPVNSRGYSPRILRWNTKHGRGYWIRTSDHGVKVRCFRPSKLTPNRTIPEQKLGVPPGTRTPTNGFGDRYAAITSERHFIFRMKNFFLFI